MDTTDAGLRALAKTAVEEVDPPSAYYIRGELEEAVFSALQAVRDSLLPYKDAIEKHLCPHDAADWIACSGHHSEECEVCSKSDKGMHRHALLLRAEKAEAALAALRAENETLRGARQTTLALFKDFEALYYQMAVSQNPLGCAYDFMLRWSARLNPPRDTAALSLDGVTHEDGRTVPWTSELASDRKRGV